MKMCIFMCGEERKSLLLTILVILNTWITFPIVSAFGKTKSSILWSENGPENVTIWCFPLRRRQSDLLR